MIPNYTQYSDKLINPDVIEDYEEFRTHWHSFSGKYINVAKSADIPVYLVGALHWRESNGDFTTYLSNGDKLGNATYKNGDSNNGSILPSNTPNTITFTLDQWDLAAIYALNQVQNNKVTLNISLSTTDINVLCYYSEMYNGLGYMKRGLPSPYILSGTTGYKKGKYIADSNYDSNAIDSQVGILPMLRAIL